MELVESYLDEVGRFIPEQQRADIQGELRDAIMGELEGRAEAAGTESTEEDERQVLAGFGHPLKVASQYQPNKYVIGPDLYPAFMQTLKAVFAVAVVALVVVALFAAQISDWQFGFFALVRMFVQMALWVGAIVVLVFVSLEYSGERLHWYDNWRPESLSKGSLGVIKRGDLVTNLITEAFFILWWNDVVVLQSWLPTFSEHHQVALSAAWVPYFWYLNILFFTLLSLHFYVLICGVWRRSTLLVELVGNTALMGIIVALVSSGGLVVVSGRMDGSTMDHLQQVVSIALLVIGGFAAWEVWKVVKTFARA